MPPKPKHKPKEPSEPRTLNLLGLQIPLTSWAISALAGLAVIGVALILYTQILGPYIEKINQRAIDKQMEEFRKHFNETPDSVVDLIPNKLKVAHYDSDGCLLISRHSSPTSAMTQAWINDPDRLSKDALTPSPGRLSSGMAGVSTAEAAGQCLNPHPGKYGTWNGEVNGCWVQIWFKWEDSCTGYTWFNSCNGTRDPNFYWTYCIH